MKESRHLLLAILGLGLLAFLEAGNFGVGGLSGPTSGRLPAILNIATRPQAAPTSLAVPLFFTPNRGQLEAPLRFSARAGTAMITFSAGGWNYVLEGPTGRWVVKFDFVGARPDVEVEGLGRTGAVVSYFKGKPSEWKTGLPAYSGLRYRDLWPGIDLIFRGDGDKLKYEFVIKAGARPEDIRMKLEGLKGATVDDEGSLRLLTGQSGITDEPPRAYAGSGKERRNVEARYALEAALDGEYSLGFSVGAYDRTQDLTIDPALTYCGYIGGSAREDGYGIAVDSAGCAYVTGFTYSDQGSFPVRGGPDLSFNGPEQDVFVAKVRADGGGLVYCGYIGGNGNDYGRRIAVDALGSAYVTGRTESDESSFPVRVGPDLTYGAPYADAFIAKVDPTGTSLEYCGYIGGSGEDEGHGVAVDGAGRAYVTGWTNSTSSSFPVKTGPGLVAGGGMDAFIARVGSDGRGFDYCGFIGGSQDDYGYAVAVDRSGNACLVGETYSSEASFPVKIGPTTAYHNNGDVFVSKVVASGASLAYCGYIGGNQSDQAGDIAVDEPGNVYVTGTTYSDANSFPIKFGPFHNLRGITDAFVAKIGLSGQGFQYCGYLGGDDADYGYGIAADASGNAYLTGATWSDQRSFPVRVGPDLTYSGEMDTFVAKLKPTGSGLDYCGYIGGGGFESGWDIACDSQGNAYVVGTTTSSESTFPVVRGPGLIYSGDMDVFVAKVGSEPGPPPGRADLTLSKTVDNIAPPAYGEVAYTLTAGNGGPEDASYVRVADMLPSTLEWLSSSASQGTYDAADGIWDAGSLGVGQAATLTLRVRVRTTGTVTNAGQVYSLTESDPNPANNLASVDLTTVPSIFPPVGLKVEALEVDYIFFKVWTNRLTWQANSLSAFPVNYFLVYRKEGLTGPPVSLAQVDGTVFQYDDRGVVPGRTYIYVVTAVDIYGQVSDLAIYPLLARPKL